MSQGKLVVTSGIKTFDIEDENGISTGRTVSFNPADQGFAEDLYGLSSKIQKIHENKSKELEETTDGAERFDISRSEDREMRESVDALFGDGFCADVFHVRLFAFADGLTVIENFLYALLDEMDESITSNMAARNVRIKKYTEKYSKYARK